MKFGDAVIYDEFGKKYNAIVLGGRDLTGDKPFVNLAFARATTDMSGKPQDLSGTGSWTKMIQNRHDVAHESVLTIDGPDGKPVIYAGGRWSPIPINIAPEPTPIGTFPDAQTAAPSAQTMTEEHQELWANSGTDSKPIEGE